MSNLTCASGEASGSSGNRPNDVFNGHLYSPTQSQPPLKRKRNLPGNPDPDAEVIALSPKTLMTRNRFVCEICNKGFQRDQNLQLHRRGHNLPWKLKQRNKEEVIRKKVYVCPETSCVHHDPSRALGDLTGIKKHFSRKHGEKNWKCEKCSKLYAVQADWKAHSKTCGTKEYRCDCGTIFSRRDSFITHRAFCDALAEESARAIIVNNPNPIIYSTHPQQPCASSTTLSSPINNLQVQPSVFSNHDNNNIIQPFLLKKEPHSFGLIRPQWLANCPPPSPPPTNGSNNLNSLSIFSTRNPNPNIGTALPGFHNVPTTSTPATSATALLQKAAQMGATISDTENNNNVSDFAHRQIQDRISNSGFVNNFTLYDNKALENDNDGATIHGGSSAPPPPPPPPPYASLVQDMMMGSFTSASGFESSTFEDAFRGFLEHNKKDNNQESHLMHGTMWRSSGDGDGDGMTRDFLGLGPFSHIDIFNIPGFETTINTSSNSNQQQTQAQKPFRG